MDEYDDPWHTVPENDTWDKIEDDATLPPCTYCLKYGLAIEDPDESDLMQSMCRHIALRAFALGKSKIGGTE